MFKLVVITLAGLFAVLYVFGDEARRQEATQKRPGPAFDFSLASFMPQSEDIEEIELTPASALSDDDAVKIAVEAGELIRAQRNGSFENDSDPVTSVETPNVPGGAAAANGLPGTALWYVSGARVNLRAGPGTGNAVVARVTLGTAAEVLSDTNADWIEIRTADGTAGWISSRYLSETAPG